MNVPAFLAKRFLLGSRRGLPKTVSLLALFGVALGAASIVVDPSHGTGRREKVLPMSRASIAAGADGIVVEVHHKPAEALSDGPQALTPDMFGELMAKIRPIAAAVGRTT